MSPALFALKAAVTILLAVVNNPTATIEQRQQAIQFGNTAIIIAQRELVGEAMPAPTAIMPPQTVTPEYQVVQTTAAPAPAYQPTLTVRDYLNGAAGDGKTYTITASEQITLKTVIFESKNPRAESIYPGLSLYDTKNNVVRDQYGNSISFRDCNSEPTIAVSCPGKDITTSEQYQKASTLGYIARMSLNLNPGYYSVNVPISANLLLVEWSDESGDHTWTAN